MGGRSCFITSGAFGDTLRVHTAILTMLTVTTTNTSKQIPGENSFSGKTTFRNHLNLQVFNEILTAKQGNPFSQNFCTLSHIF